MSDTSHAIPNMTCMLVEPPCKAILTFEWPDSAPHVETVNLAIEKKREALAAKVCKLAGLEDSKPVAEQLARLAADMIKAAQSGEQKPPASEDRDELLALLDSKTEEALTRTPPPILAEAERYLLDPHLMNHLVADIESAGVVGETLLALSIYIIASSRQLERPLAGVAQGLSSSGKTHVAERVGILMPPEAIIRATDITAQALYYMEPGALMHRCVLNGERRRSRNDEHAEATRALRQMISDRELRKIVTSKSPSGGMLAAQIWQPGPIAYFETTTRTEIFDEDANRALLLGTDESAEQTARIVKAQAAAAMGKHIDCSPVILKHHAAQRLLRRVRVEVPYAMALADAIPTSKQEARRAMPQILSVVSAIALLHQRQRASGAIVHGQTIQARVSDYVVARRLLAEPLGRSLGRSLAPAVERLAKRLRDRYGDGDFTTTIAAKEDEIVRTKGKMNEYVRTLHENGIAEQVEEAKGSKPATWRVSGEIPEGGALWLPDTDALEGFE